ncbi:hypothetical protein [Luteolibacter sp. Populi]|uniref:hypothetical protein n=1 Tax=Luteolibacter sp. Populi TaxID=3230487 RepID=UPI003467CA74
MKSGFLDLLLATAGWVVGKTCLFALAALTGIAIGAVALWAGTMAGGGGFGFPTGESPIFGQLSTVIALLAQGVILFWAAMFYVRSEKAGGREWLMIAAGEALLLTGCFSLALPGGLGASIVSWCVCLGLLAGLKKIASRFGHRQIQRGIDHLEKLKEDNARRRVEMTAKYGTVSTGAEELGIL